MNESSWWVGMHSYMNRSRDCRLWILKVSSYKSLGDASWFQLPFLPNVCKLPRLGLLGVSKRILAIWSWKFRSASSAITSSQADMSGQAWGSHSSSSYQGSTGDDKRQDHATGWQFRFRKLAAFWPGLKLTKAPYSIRSIWRRPYCRLYYSNLQCRLWCLFRSNSITRRTIWIHFRPSLDDSLSPHYIR